jgi:N-acyl-D-glutamate deacylase
VEHVLVNGSQVHPAAAGMPRPGKILRRETMASGAAGAAR